MTTYSEPTVHVVPAGKVRTVEVLAWVAALLPGVGRPAHSEFVLDTVGFDGARWWNPRRRMSVIVSGAHEQDGKRWLHVSCAHPSRLPDWEELRLVKDVFVGEDLYAVQVLPPRARYVNINANCLHLFCCVDGHPLPEFTRGGKSL